MLIQWILKGLLLLPPEQAHYWALYFLKMIYRPSLVRHLRRKFPSHPVNCGGLTLPNPVGLAAGMDKNGYCLDSWFGISFGFVEVGTVTPKAQQGNPKPRLFRLADSHALINRMGFNNKGVDALVSRLKQRCIAGIVGVNIGKNRETPLEHAARDYLYCLQAVYPYADYVTINISSPNTPGLRHLQSHQSLTSLLDVLILRRNQLAAQLGKRLPLWVKIAPDLEVPELLDMLSVFLDYGIDGIIATNTTVDHQAVAQSRYGHEAGGLSGSPLFPKMKQIVQLCLKQIGHQIPIIAVGGIDSPQRAQEMLAIGASAVQIYSSLVYQGPSLVHKILNEL